MYKFDREKYDKRMQWFTHDRFGMFIHWGLYAIPARGEWVRSTEEIPEEDYIPFFNEFNPKDFDPKKWARLAKQAGMKYAVLTAKHCAAECSGAAVPGACPAGISGRVYASLKSH